jgi:hypothetical protein
MTRPRIITDDSKVTIFIKPIDYAHLDGEMLIALDEGTAEDLMHALEEWKDER